MALDAYAKSEDIRYEQDEVLTAAYFSTYQGYNGADKHPIDMDWETSKWVDVTEDSVLTVNSDILTADLLAAAKNAPEVTADDHPRWTGLVFGYEYSGMLKDEVSRFQQTADWGFNSIQLKVDYEVFFNPDATSDYDVFLGLAEEVGLERRSTSTVLLWPYEEFDRGRHVVIHDDLCYSTDAVHRQANTDTISAAMKAIAEVLEHSPSTISREVKRNRAKYRPLGKTDNKYWYNHWRANNLYIHRRREQNRSALEPDTDQWDYIILV